MSWVKYATWEIVTSNKDRPSLLTIYIEYQGSIKNQITKDTVESPFFHLINTIGILAKSENGHLTWKKIMATSPYRKSATSLCELSVIFKRLGVVFKNPKRLLRTPN